MKIKRHILRTKRALTEKPNTIATHRTPKGKQSGKLLGWVDKNIKIRLCSDDLLNSFDLFKSSDNNASLDVFDGYSLHGWSEEASEVRLFIDGELLGTYPLDVTREDLTGVVANIGCGFSVQLDAAQYKTGWREKNRVTVRAEFVDSAGQISSKHQQVVCSKALLMSVQTLNGSHLLEIAGLIREQHLWDEGFYQSQLEGVAIRHDDLVLDYLIVGSKSGLNPCESFDTNYYLAHSPDVLLDGGNPFHHYLAAGEAEGRAPNWYFNPGIYLQKNPDLANWDASLLAHYVLYGQPEGRPCNDFPTKVSEGSFDPYEKWRLTNETLSFKEILNGIHSFKLNPLISIVVPVYNPDAELLEACIDSVLAQSYENWELCLADDCSPKKHVKEVLEKYSKLDKRIKVVYRKKNGHISEASNSALEVASGEWTALLDHDDELHEHALYHVVDTLNQNPDAQFIYSDEDKIDEEGNRFDPHFKSQWNLDLLYSQNYVSHLGVYQTALVKEIGGFRKGLEGSQDYDLLLRYSENIEHANIIHIPKVLYHWRAVEGSTALGSGEKSYTTEAGIKALEDHFASIGQKVTVQRGKHDNTYKVDWPTTDATGQQPLVSLVIPTYNGYEITKQAIDSIMEKSTYKNFEILLVDNNSDDPVSLEYFKEIDAHPQVTVLRYPHPFNYSAINNFAVAKAEGEVIGLVNNDIEIITPEWLDEMVSNAIRPDVGCVGAMLYYADDTIQHAGVISGLGGVAGHSHKYFPKGHPGYYFRLEMVQNLSAVTAACLIVRKSVFEEVSGLNEKELSIAFNDVDFCLKVQAAGYRNLWTPYAEAYHHESVSRGAEDNPEKVARFNKEIDYMKSTWQTDKHPDRYYSPNLTLAREDFSLN